jgi:3-methyladenine DNA glycosylase/8-oxoguanine DNA glycosylase
MVFMDDRLEHVVDIVGRVARTAMVPWGGAEACLDAYEAAIRAATDAQLNVARVVGVEPMRSFVASCADLTRDIGAAHLSSARWILDV